MKLADLLTSRHNREIAARCFENYDQAQKVRRYAVIMVESTEERGYSRETE
jgi:hypothetical protein